MQDGAKVTTTEREYLRLEQKPGRGTALPPRREGVWFERGVIAGLITVGLATLAQILGCAATGRANLAAADAIEALSGEVRTAVEEYQRDLENLDDQRRIAAVTAYTRLILQEAEKRPGHPPEAGATQVGATGATAAIADHQAAFVIALERLDADGDASRLRAANTLENINALLEIASSLRRLAVESLKLDAESQAVFSALVETAKRTQTAPEKPRPP